MISKVAIDDFEDLRAQGLNPTLEDFDRLNQLALRLTDGAETSCANFPRVGWAGDCPFYQPTLAAFAWYHGYAARLASDDETADTFWFFALAHAREPKFFDALRTRDEIEAAVKAWAESLPVTHDEVVRACRYAVTGFSDAVAAKNDDGRAGAPRTPIFRADRSEAAKNLARVEQQLVAACAALKCPPVSLMGETQTRLDALCEAAEVELGKTVTKDQAKLQAAYDLTLREITMRLKAEKESKERNAQRDGDKDSGGDVGDDIPLIPGTQSVRRVASSAPGQKPEDVIVVAHGGNDTKSDAGVQG
jgi:hypothetical protein